MTTNSNVLFNDALDRALEVVIARGALLATEVTLVRDLRGRIRAVLPLKPADTDLLRTFETQLSLDFRSLAKIGCETRCHVEQAIRA